MFENAAHSVGKVRKVHGRCKYRILLSFALRELNRNTWILYANISAWLLPSIKNCGIIASETNPLFSQILYRS